MNYNTKLNKERNLEKLISEIGRKGVQNWIYKECENWILKKEDKHLKSKISKKGYFKKKILTRIGKLTFKIPKVSFTEEKFYPSIFTKYDSRTKEIDKMMFELYCNGLSFQEIANQVFEIWEYKVCKQTVSNVCEKLSKTYENFNTRKLKKEYKFVYSDAIYLSIKDKTRKWNSKNKKAIYSILGIDKQGVQEHLGYCIHNNETKWGWNNFFKTIKERGVEKIDLFISDGHKSIKDAIKDYFPDAKWQRCLFHVANELKKTIKGNKIEKDEFFREFYKAFTLENEYEVRIALNNVISKWKKKSIMYFSKTHYEKNPNSLINAFENALDSEGLFTYLQFDEKIHKSIRTNNLIESHNQKTKLAVSHKKQFDSLWGLIQFLNCFFSKKNLKLAK